ncbi:MAG: CPBP family intramembrane metalloprotease, partial [Thermoplasmata archaeon]
YEELFFRMSLIGIPLLIIALIQFLIKAKKKLPRPHRYLLGGGSSFGVLPLVFLLLSSVNFAYAHVQSNPASEAVFHFLPTLLAGLMLGYLFLEKGIHAAIIFHFSVNYMFMLTYADNAGFVHESLGLIFLPFSTIAFILLLVSGAVAGPLYFCYYSNRAIKCLKMKVREIGSDREKGKAGKAEETQSLDEP